MDVVSMFSLCPPGFPAGTLAFSHCPIGIIGYSKPTGVSDCLYKSAL